MKIITKKLCQIVRYEQNNNFLLLSTEPFNRVPIKVPSAFITNVINMNTCHTASVNAISINKQRRHRPTVRQTVSDLPFSVSHIFFFFCFPSRISCYGLHGPAVFYFHSFFSFSHIQNKETPSFRSNGKMRDNLRKSNSDNVERKQQ